MSNFDDLKLSVEALSGGKNTVLLDDQGMPSIMVRIPKFYLDEVIDGAAHVLHPAFIVNGVEKEEIFVSKFQNIVLNDRAYSLPFKDPRDYVTFDQAVTYAKNKGAGWHLMTNAEWAAIALWCKKNGFMPRGNNDYGKAYSAAYEKGKRTYGSGDTTYRVATGSGPVSWAHDNTNAGIFDLNGNVWEWSGGLRLNDGEIHVIENNNAADNAIDQSAASAAWKAISSVDGSLLAPGSADTLKYDALSPIQLAKTITTTAAKYNAFQDMSIAADVTVTDIVKALGLAPIDADHGGDRLYVNNEGERLPVRGGGWGNQANAGVFALNLSDPRSDSSDGIGFRAAFV